MDLPAYAWEAPSWTGAAQVPALYQDHETLLLCCALLEEMLPGLRREVEPERDSTALPGGLAGDVPRLRLEVQAFLARAQRDLGALGEHLEAEAARDTAAAEIVALVAILLGGAPAACTPETALGLVQRALGEAADQPPAVRTVDRLRAEVARYAEAAGTLAVEPRPFWDVLTELELEGRFLLQCVGLVAQPRARQVPRAPPGDADRGSFPLSLAALERCAVGVRALAAADAWLRAPRGTGREEARRAQRVRQGRARLVAVVERAAQDSQEHQRARTLRGAYDELLALCQDAILRCGLDPAPLLAEQQRSLHGMAATILTSLVGREDLAAQQACAQLSQSMAWAPSRRPPAPGANTPTAEEQEAARQLWELLGAGP